MVNAAVLLSDPPAGELLLPAVLAGETADQDGSDDEGAEDHRLERHPG